MGIPGLARRLEPYAVRYTKEELAGRTAIIDGPGLAYDAHRIAAAAAASRSRIPTYADINAEAIRWLKSLQSIDIKVSAILFDGALPTSKKHERVSRFQQSIKRVTNFRATYPTTACPIPGQLAATAYSFLAPSLMEALYLSEFAQVTRLVPGEADDWCASCANDNPRTIVFTSDTDLVLYEYPPECLIIFFKDVSLLPNPEFRAYSPITICKRLKLSSFIPLAYAIVQEPGKSLSENIEDAENCDLNSDAYLDFSKRYTTKIQTPSYVHNRPVVNVALQKLDVRVSEFVHQALGHILVPIIYLPFLLEDPHLAASWNLGEDLRILAYSLLSPNRVAVQEYQRRAQSITVQEHTLYPLEKTQSTAVKLLDNISAWIQWTADVNLPRGLIWPLFGVSLTLAQLQYPPKVSRLAGVINGDFDNTWDFVHLTARVHAVSYSLRLFKQCIEVWLALYETNVSGGLHDIILRLNQALESFPTIADMFTIPGQPKKEVLADDGTLRQALTNMYAGSSIKVPDEHTSKKKRKQERKAREKDEKKNLVREAGAKKPGANVFNVFDVLDRRTLS